MGKRLVRALAGQDDFACRQPAHLQQSGVRIDGPCGAFAQEIDGQAGRDGVALARGADHGGIHGQVRQAHQHRAGDDAAQALVRVAGGQHRAGGASADVQHVDAQQEREGVLVGQQNVEIGQADQGRVGVGGQGGCGHRCSRARQ
ncbi:hypothetical protein D3C71_1733800 [compost metagenome]